MESRTVDADAGSGSQQRIGAIAAAWVLSLGFDIFLHGGVLAHLYTNPGPFLLEPGEAFRRIPLGYLAYLSLTAALFWLLRRLSVRGASAGFRFGATAGAVVWGAWLVGLYSVSTAPLSLLTGWWIGQTLQFGLAGTVLGASLGGMPLTRAWLVVALSVAGFVAATVLMQSLGLAPAMRIAR